MTISQPILKVTFAECVCEKAILEPIESTGAVDSGLVEEVKKSIEWKREPRYPPKELELDDEHELNACLLWGHNWRQFTSVLPGILLLFTIGLHNVFTVYELDYFTTAAPPHLRGSFKDRSAFDPVPTALSRNNSYGEYAYDDVSPGSYSDFDFSTKNRRSTLVVLMWYLGAILGSMLCAVLIRKMKKRSLYVNICWVLVQLRRSFPFFISFTVFGCVFTNYWRPLLLHRGKLLQRLQIGRQHLHRSVLAIHLCDRGKTYFGHRIRHGAFDGHGSRIRHWIETDASSNHIRNDHDHCIITRFLRILDGCMVPR